MVKSQKMRVLHYIPAFDKGGIESLVLNLIKQMNNTIDFSVIAEKKLPKEAEEIIKEAGGTVYTIPKLNLKNLLKHKKAIQKILQQEKFDVVHCHSASTRPFVLLYAKKLGVPKRIYHAHSVQYENKKYSFFKNRIRRLSIKSSNCCIACSENAAYVFKNRKYEIVHNGIVVEDFKYNDIVRKKIREQLKIDDKFVIGHIGRFSPLKNHKFMIDLMCEINKQKENTILLLVGDGPEKKHIEEYVREKKMQNKVIFLGNIDNVQEILQAIDVFIFPSLSEAMPLTPIEAQASGLKVITSEAVIPDLKCTEYFTRISLKEGIQKWCKEILNTTEEIDREDQYKKIIEKGFDFQKMLEKLEDIYKNN